MSRSGQPPRRIPPWVVDVMMPLIGVGTVIRRRHTHFGAPIEGTMEIVEYEPDRAMGTVIHYGALEIRSRVSFEPEGQRGTRVTISIDVPEAKSPIDPAPMEVSLREMKRLIESEVESR